MRVVEEDYVDKGFTEGEGRQVRPVEVRRLMVRVNEVRLGLRRWTGTSLLPNGRFAAGEGSARGRFVYRFHCP
jgi:hypothetical protein